MPVAPAIAAASAALASSCLALEARQRSRLSPPTKSTRTARPSSHTVIEPRSPTLDRGAAVWAHTPQPARLQPTLGGIGAVLAARGGTSTRLWALERPICAVPTPTHAATCPSTRQSAGTPAPPTRQGAGTPASCAATSKPCGKVSVLAILAREVAGAAAPDPVVALILLTSRGTSGSRRPAPRARRSRTSSQPAR